MIAFVSAALALTVATCAAISFGLLRRPRAAGADADELNAAVYREQIAEIDAALREGTLGREAHGQARDAIRTRLAHELAARAHAVATPAGPARWQGLACALFVAAAAPLLYSVLGHPEALRAAAPTREAAHALQGAQMAAMVERLAARLRGNPEDVEGWVMLARSYSALGRFDAAAAAFGEASQRAPRDAGLLADRADVAAMAQGRRFEGEPDRLIERALAIEPRHAKSLALAGSSAFARGDYVKAVAHWTRLREALPPGSEAATRVEANLAQARAALAPAPVRGPATARAAVSGVVSVAPALAARVQPGDTLFIFARAPQGSRMPLAIVRRPVGTWPVRFRLDDSQAMSPAARLSGQSQVLLEARISRSGSANAAPGDLRVMAGPVAVGAEGVSLAIDAVVE